MGIHLTVGEQPEFFELVGGQQVGFVENEDGGAAAFVFLDPAMARYMPMDQFAQMEPNLAVGIANLLVVLESGGRIAATRATRRDGQTILDNAVYSPCPVTTESGCPKTPSWYITAARVTLASAPASNQ